MQNRQVLEKEWAEEKPVNENMEWRAWWSTPLIPALLRQWQADSVESEVRSSQ